MTIATAEEIQEMGARIKTILVLSALKRHAPKFKSPEFMKSF
jgi:hypothetical protein